MSLLLFQTFLVSVEKMLLIFLFMRKPRWKGQDVQGCVLSADQLCSHTDRQKYNDHYCRKSLIPPNVSVQCCTAILITFKLLLVLMQSGNVILLAFPCNKPSVAT